MLKKISEKVNMKNIKYSIYNTGDTLRIITKNGSIHIISISSNGFEVKQIDETLLSVFETKVGLPVCTGYITDMKNVFDKVKELSYAGVFENDNDKIN